MTGQIIARARPDGFEALTAFNKPVFESHAEIVNLLAQRRGQHHAELFARPIAENGQIAWETPLTGPVRRWTQLTHNERAALETTRLALGEDLAGLVAELARSGINSRLGNLAQLVHAALEVPGLEHLYVVGDRLVLTFWGFRGGSGQRFDPLARLPEPPPVVVPALPPRRSRWWLWLALLLLLLLLAAVAAWYLDLFKAPARAPIPPPPLPVVPAPESPPAAPPVPEPPPQPAPVTPVPPDLPQDRWDRGDISLLEGCWLLGSEHPMVHYNNDRPIEEGTAHAGKLCFDASGHGSFSIDIVYPSGPISCEAPLTATFADGKLHTRQPRGNCHNSEWWEALALSCSRNPDGTADCLPEDKPNASPYHFRRDAGAATGQQ